MSPDEHLSVLLFDGDCAFCNGWVRWLLRHERRPSYRFATLQSAAAAPLLAAYGVAPGDLGSVVVIDRGQLYRKSAAALHLLRETRWPWRLLGILNLVPRAVRDAAYDYVGAHRYRWWGKAEHCVLADATARSRVLPSESASPSS